MIFRDWTWDQWKAFGRHIGTYAGGIITGAVTLHLIAGADGATLLQAIKDISEGLGKVAAGVAAIIGVVGPLYTSIKSSRSAAPEAQAAQTVKNLEAGVPLNGKRDQLIAAVAAQPDVAKVEMVNPAKAERILCDKVV